MSAISTVVMSFVDAIFNAASNVGSAGATLARAVVNAAINDVEHESIVQAIADGIDHSGGSAAVYKSQAKRLLAADADMLRTIWAEREAALSWVNMGNLIRAYEVPSVSSSGAKKGGKSSTKSDAPKQAGEGQSKAEYLAGLRAYLAGFSKVSANMAAQDALNTAVTLLASEVSADAKKAEVDKKVN